MPLDQWSVGSNASGAMISSSGNDTAGAEGGVTDIVRVTDAGGALAQATVAVGMKLTITPDKPSTPPNGSVSFPATGGLAISPADLKVPTSGKIAFEAFDGSGHYTWSLATASGGTIDPSSGAYVAGTAGNTIDVVLATDSLGNKSSVEVKVGPSLTITPAASEVISGAKIAFTGQGGSGRQRCTSACSATRAAVSRAAKASSPSPRAMVKARPLSARRTRPAPSATLSTALFAARSASSRSFASRMLAALMASKSSTAIW